MTIASEKNKRSTARWMLIRMTPSRQVSADLSSLGSGLYGMTFNFPVSSVERNGVALTETTTNPPGSNDQWFVDESDGTFKIKLASAPSITTNVIVIKYNIFYCTGDGQHTYETPTDSTTPLRLWLPRVTAAPELSIGFENSLSGVMTINGTSMQIANHDADFQKYLTDNDNFNFAECFIWTAINSNSNIDLGYKGLISSVYFNRKSVDITILDNFSKLNKPAYFGDLASECIYFPSTFNVSQERAYFPCPIILAPSSVGDQWSGKAAIGLTTPSKVEKHLGASDWNEAVNIDYFSSGSRLQNRDHGLCRVPAAGLKVQTFGTLSRVALDGRAFMAYFTAHNLETGMIVSWIESAVRYHGIVTRAEAGETWTTSGNTYNVHITQYTGIGLYPDSFADITISSVFDALKCVSIVHNATTSGNLERIYQITNFTVDVATTTQNGNIFVKAILNDNMEATPLPNSQLRTFNPDTDKIFYKVWLSDSCEFNHAEVIRDICGTAGLTVQPASVAAAKTALDVKTYFQIPYIGQTEYATSLEYVQDLSSSAFSYLSITDDGDIVYKLIAAPIPTETITADMIIGDLQIDINYQDIVTKIFARNPASANSDSYFPVQYTDTQYSEVSNDYAKYTYGIDRTVEIVHLLRTIAGRIALILSNRSFPLIVYTFSTATINIDSRLGDDITIEHPDVLGLSGSVDAKIVSITRSVDQTVIRAAIIYGV